VSPGGELTPLKNAQQLLHRIAFVHRGGCPLLAKVRAAQAAGAFAVVVADVDGKCAGIFDQHCSPGADKARGEGLAATDSAIAWERIRIPVAMMHKEDSDKIEALLSAEKSDKPGEPAALVELPKQAPVNSVALAAAKRAAEADAAMGDAAARAASAAASKAEASTTDASTAEASVTEASAEAVEPADAAAEVAEAADEAAAAAPVTEAVAAEGADAESAAAKTATAPQAAAEEDSPPKENTKKGGLKEQLKAARAAAAAKRAEMEKVASGGRGAK
jgi:hypothetical protein